MKYIVMAIVVTSAIMLKADASTNCREVENLIAKAQARGFDQVANTDSSSAYISQFKANRFQLVYFDQSTPVAMDFSLSQSGHGCTAVDVYLPQFHAREADIEIEASETGMIFLMPGNPVNLFLR